MSLIWSVVAGLVIAPIPVIAPISVVSVSIAEEPGNHNSTNPAVSADGRFVAFESLASNLVPGDTNGVNDVFLRDRRTGVTTSIAPTGSGEQPIAHSLVQPTISDDGRTVAFTTRAPALVPPGTSGYQVLVHDNRR